ncbi:MAG: glycosyltransferase [Planctomycetota bacterium]|nr:MAG: glycosyltransferase [Planctomycetota bacterium]REK43596.1 MAG: glycosyltransferase [Planctomycetota bacterium]
MKPIKITHIVYNLQAGGLENGVVNICNRLDPARFESSICVFSAGGELEERLDRDRVELFTVKRHFGNDPSVPLRIARHLRRRGTDIVHSHNWVTLVEGAAARLLARTPVLVHGEHGYPVEDRPRNVRVQRFVWNKVVTQLLSVSQELAGTLADLTDLAEDRFEVIPNGVDTERFRPAPEQRAALRAELGLPTDGLMIGMVARFDPVKNHSGAIRALARLRQRGLDVHLAFAGTGERQSLLAEVAREEQVADRVHFLGYRADVNCVYQALDVFLLNSHREGMSNTVIEAMSCGLPVVATRVGANPECLVDEESGLLVPPDDSATLAERLARLVDDELRARFATAARRRIEEEFSIDRMVERYAALYERLCPRKVLAAAEPSGREPQAMENVAT